METPKVYRQFLAQGICDEQMMADVIYSFNKRAKNYRDKFHEYRKYEWRTKAEEMMKLYYNKKGRLLLQLFPEKAICIHRHKIYKEKYHYYDRNPYYSNWKQDDNDSSNEYEEKINYYLYIKIGDKSFHHPIPKINKFLKDERFKHLEIIDLPDDFYTEGQDVSSLLSPQFCNKVYERFIS